MGNDIKEFIHGKHVSDAQKMRCTKLDYQLVENDMSYKELAAEICGTISYLGTASLQALVGKIKFRMGGDNDWEDAKTAGELVAVLSSHPMFDHYYDSVTNYIMIRSNLRLGQEVMDFITNTKFLPPLIIEPMEVTNVNESGYFTFNESLILNNNNHDFPVSLDSINILNKTALSMDRYVLSLDEEVTPKLIEKFNEDTSKMTVAEKILAFERESKASRITYDEIMKTGNRFYLTNRYDARGRTYSKGYHINIQSTEYKKALINFNKKELISDELILWETN